MRVWSGRWNLGAVKEDDCGPPVELFPNGVERVIADVFSITSAEVSFAAWVRSTNSLASAPSPYEDDSTTPRASSSSKANSISSRTPVTPRSPLAKLAP